MSHKVRRASGAIAVFAMVATAIGLPVTAPESTDGASPMMAIARADCPPDCGGGPGNGGTPIGPPGGGTEFVPPSMPATPSYDPGRGQPPLDQNNGISIYNSAAPQPSQAAQPSQSPVQNQDGSYNRAANGEQQRIQYSQAPGNQQVNSQWQQLSDQLNSPGESQVNQPDRPDQANQDRCGQLWSQLANLPTGGDDSPVDIRSALEEADCGLSAPNPRQSSIRRLADSRVNIKQDAGTYNGVECLKTDGDLWSPTFKGVSASLQYIAGAVHWTLTGPRGSASDITPAAPLSQVFIGGNGLSANFWVCPEGVGSEPAAGPPTAVSGYRGHVLRRMDERGWTRGQIEDAVDNPKGPAIWQPDKGTWLYRGQNGINVAVNPGGEVVTVF